MIRMVLFDLDGTLADTAPDLADALNHALVSAGRAPLPYEAIRPVVSHGAMALTRFGFGLAPDDPVFARHRQCLLDYYAANIARRTTLFPGMAEVLDAIEGRGFRWGVVTNKPAGLTLPLLEALGLRGRAATIVSGDTLPQRKPDPAPMLLACREADCPPAACVYVGDAERDIQAGRAAGMATLVALFGYIGEQDRPAEWQADGMVEQPLDIIDWVDRSGVPFPRRAR